MGGGQLGGNGQFGNGVTIPPLALGNDVVPLTRNGVVIGYLVVSGAGTILNIELLDGGRIGTGVAGAIPSLEYIVWDRTNAVLAFYTATAQRWIMQINEFYPGADGTHGIGTAGRRILNGFYSGAVGWHDGTRFRVALDSTLGVEVVDAAGAMLTHLTPLGHLRLGDSCRVGTRAANATGTPDRCYQLYDETALLIETYIANAARLQVGWAGSFCYGYFAPYTDNTGVVGGQSQRWADYIGSKTVQLHDGTYLHNCQVQIPDAIQTHFEIDVRPWWLTLSGVGCTDDFTTNQSIATLISAVAVNAVWQMHLKLVGQRTWQAWIWAIDGDTLPTFQWGEFSQADADYFKLEKGTNANTIKITTLNSVTAGTETADNLAANPANTNTHHKVTMAAGATGTKYYANNTLLWTSATHPVPMTITMRGRITAIPNGGVSKTVYCDELDEWPGVIV